MSVELSHHVRHAGYRANGVENPIPIAPANRTIERDMTVAHVHGNRMRVRHHAAESAVHAFYQDNVIGMVVAEPMASGRDPRVQSVTVTRDEAFLSELDASISRAAVPELRALDAFTPRAGDLPR